MDISEIIMQCAVALLTFVLGWILPQPQRIVKALLDAANRLQPEEKEKP